MGCRPARLLTRTTRVQQPAWCGSMAHYVSPRKTPRPTLPQESSSHGVPAARPPYTYCSRKIRCATTLCQSLAHSCVPRKGTPQDLRPGGAKEIGFEPRVTLRRGTQTTTSMASSAPEASAAVQKDAGDPPSCWQPAPARAPGWALPKQHIAEAPGALSESRKHWRVCLLPGEQLAGSACIRLGRHSPKHSWFTEEGAPGERGPRRRELAAQRAPAAACPRRAVPRSAAQRRTSARPRPAARSSQLLHTKKREPERAGPAWMEMLQCSAGCALCKPVPVKVTPSPAAAVPTGYTRRQPGARNAARHPDTACQGSRDEAVSPACLSWLPRCCPTLSRAALVMAAALSCTRRQALSPLRRPVSGGG